MRRDSRALERDRRTNSAELQGPSTAFNLYASSAATKIAPNVNRNSNAPQGRRSTYHVGKDRFGIVRPQRSATPDSVAQRNTIQFTTISA